MFVSPFALRNSKKKESNVKFDKCSGWIVRVYAQEVESIPTMSKIQEYKKYDLPVSCWSNLVQGDLLYCNIGRYAHLFLLKCVFKHLQKQQNVFQLQNSR